MNTLQKFVAEQGCDAGFAYDGDADRCIAVDDKGEEVNGDLIMYVCGKYMKECGKLNNNTIVTTSNVEFRTFIRHVTEKEFPTKKQQWEINMYVKI